MSKTKTALLTVKEVGEVTSLSKTTIHRLLAKGVLHSVKIGRARRVPASALETYLDRLSAEADVA